MRNLSALVCGAFFGLGLFISNCTDTEVIFAWLDVFGHWEPTLGFFFVASAGVMAIGWRLTRHQTTSYLGDPMPKQNRASPDARLVAGSVMFGIGWGLSGVCPGPSMAGLSFNGIGGSMFFAAMVAGMALAAPLMKYLALRTRRTAPAH